MSVMRDFVTELLSVTRAELKAQYSEDPSAFAKTVEYANTDQDSGVVANLLKELLQVCIAEVLSTEDTGPN